MIFRSGMLALLFMLAGVAGVPAAAAEKTVFGPVKYDVTERYGKANRFTAAFPASEALYLIKIENGEKFAERSDWLELSINGATVLRNDQYLYQVLAGFVRLKADTTFELVLRDNVPQGFRRPAALPRNAIISVLPAPANMKALTGVFGLHTWEGLKDLSEALLKIKNPEALQFAVTAAGLQNDLAARLEAARKLTDLKEKNAQGYLLRTFRDMSADPDIRAEAGLGLGLIGDKNDIAILMRGVIDSDEKISTGSARGLSFYPEEDTQEQLISTLEQMDDLRKGAVIRNIVSAGWKPVGAMIKMADTKDPHITAIALHLLGGMNDPRATTYLLQLLDDPGNKDVRSVISALGETRDPRAAERLLTLANDPSKRAGSEVELCEALAGLGEQRAVKAITDMIHNARSNIARSRMKSSYKLLTGKDLGR